MAKFDWSQIKPSPGFDSRKWLRKARAEIKRETEGMTDEQIFERHRQLIEEDIRMRAEQAKAESAES
jgi:hypothetical protein